MQIDFHNSTVATIEFNAGEEINARRGLDCVSIGLPFRISVQPEPEGCTWQMTDIGLDLYAVVDGAERLFAVGSLGRALESRRSTNSERPIVEMRCTPKAVAEYEEARRGDRVVMRLKFYAKIHELEVGSGYHRMLCQTQSTFAQEDFQVDKNKWIRALRGIGLSASVLVEIPFPLESFPNNKALDALTAAFEAFGSGGSTAWKDCVGHIRPYLEEWKDTSPTPPAQPKGSTADRKLKILTLRDALYKCCHFWVHESAAETSRDDALLALATFAALLRAHRNP